MARILYIHQYFKTPDEGGSIRSWHIAREMVAAGHQVDMLTAWSGKAHKIVEIDGIKVHYLPVAYDQSMGTARRIWAFWRFARLARRHAETLQKPDLIYATSTPLSVGIPAKKLKERWGIPFVFEVRDLWPEAPIQLGVIRGKWLKKHLYQLEKTIYAAADSIIALSPLMEAGVRKVNDKVPVHMVPNMADTHFFQPKGSADKPFGESNPLRFAYTGAAGYSNDIAFICSLASAVKDLPVRFDLMTAGAELEMLRSLTSSFPSIHWHAYGSKQKVADLLGDCHFSMVLFKENTILSYNSPNKFFDGLAAGKAILVNIPGWVAALVEENDCGWVLCRGDEASFARKVKELIKNPTQLPDMQEASRTLAMTQFDRRALCKRVLGVVSSHLTQTR